MNDPHVFRGLCSNDDDDDDDLCLDRLRVSCDAG